MTWTTLHDAAEHLNVETALYRAKHNPEELCSVDEHGSTPLHLVCWKQDPPLELVQGLIDECPQTVSGQDTNGDTPLHVALTFSKVKPELVKVLLDACPTVTSIHNKEGLYPLHQACRYCASNDRVIGLLLEAYPYATRSRTKMGELPPKKHFRDPLKEARPTDHFILDAGSPRTVTNAFELRFQEMGVQIRSGSYPLHMAIGAGAPRAVVEMLIVEAPLVITWTDKHGNTALHVAVAQQNRDNVSSVLEALLATEEGRQAVRMVDKANRNLPLHTAVLHGCTDQVAKQLLLEYPESIHVENAHHKTPLDLARDKCSPDVIALLEISNESE